jgi:hypothetical protein
MKSETNNTSRQDGVGCNVDQTFNFSMGAVALALAGVIGWFVWHWLTGAPQ